MTSESETTTRSRISSEIKSSRSAEVNLQGQLISHKLSFWSGHKEKEGGAGVVWRGWKLRRLVKRIGLENAICGFDSDKDRSGQSVRKARVEFLTVLMSFSIAFNTLREACTLMEWMNDIIANA